MHRQRHRLDSEVGAEGNDEDPLLLSVGVVLLLLVVVGIVSLVVGVGVGVEVGGGAVGWGVEVGVGTSVGLGGGGGAGSSLRVGSSLLGSSSVSDEVSSSLEELDDGCCGDGTGGSSGDRPWLDSLVEVSMVVIGSSSGTGNRVADSLFGVCVP